jgi:hypothetical protein
VSSNLTVVVWGCSIVEVCQIPDLVGESSNLFNPIGSCSVVAIMSDFRSGDVGANPTGSINPNLYSIIAAITNHENLLR